MPRAPSSPPGGLETWSATLERPVLALGWFAGQFISDLAWSAAFFGARSPVAGLVVIAALSLASVGTVVAFDRVDRRAAALLVPDPARVSFAAVPNYGFWALN